MTETAAPSRMSVVKNKVNSTKNFVHRHRVALAVTATAVTTTSLFVALQISNAAAWNQFLVEHDLFETYYSMLEDVPTVTAQ